MFPPSENMVRLFLEDAVSVPVKTRVPNPRPDAFVRVWRTGGPAVNRILDAPLITVESWAETDPAASQVANECRDALLNRYTEMPLVRGVEEVTGPYYDPDPDSGTPRFSFTVRLLVRRPRA